MEQTPTFRMTKDFPRLGAKGNIIKMSPKSMEEFDDDEEFDGWRDSVEAIDLKEELRILSGK